MKQLIRRTLTSLSIAVLWLAGMAHAQSTWVIKVHIPFEFAVGDKTFPSGDYSLVQPLQHFLVLRDARGQTIASTFTHGVQSSTLPSNAKLKFYSSDNRHVLAEVWQREESVGHQLVLPKQGVTLARQRTANTPGETGGSRP